MKKWFIIAVPAILIVIISSIVYSMNAFPKLGGNQIHAIKVIDMELNVLAHWSLLENRRSSDRDKMTTVLKAFTYGPSTKRNNHPPSFWIQIGVRNGSTMDYLVWLEEGQPATYMYGTQADYQLFGIGETAAYPIEDEIMDDILRILSMVEKKDNKTGTNVSISF